MKWGRYRENGCANLAGLLDEARTVETEMKNTLFGIYGGEKIACWLTRLKYYMPPMLHPGLGRARFMDVSIHDIGACSLG